MNKSIKKKKHDRENILSKQPITERQVSSSQWEKPRREKPAILWENANNKERIQEDPKGKAVSKVGMQLSGRVPIKHV